MTLETAGSDVRRDPHVDPIRPAGTGTLQMDVPEGEYEIRAADRRIDAAALTVGAPRPSAQDELLLP